MASFLSKLRDIFLPAPDADLAFTFGRDVAHEFIALYHQIDKDKGANKMSKRDKYRLIAAIKNYHLIFGDKPKTDKLIDIWLRRVEDGITLAALISLDDNLKVFEESMNVRFDILELFANRTFAELNLTIITGFSAELRFIKKYKVGDDLFHYAPAIWAGVRTVIPIEI